jgi:putative ABC transport system permease protein
VAVVGSETATELFGATEAVGQSVFYNGTELEIVGVLETVDSSAETTSNDLVIVPLSTYSQRLIGGSDRNSVDSIYVKATSAETLSAAYEQATNLLGNLHGIDDSEDIDFSIATRGVDPPSRHEHRRHPDRHAVRNRRHLSSSAGLG